MTDQPRLYTPAGIALGTLLGSLAAGAVLLWLNYRSLGHVRLAHKVGAGGLMAYLLILAVASTLPSSLALGTALVLLQTLLAYWVADALQGEAVRYHRARGGRTHSLAWAGGMGFLAGLSVVLVLLAALSLLGVPVVPTAPEGGA